MESRFHFAGSFLAEILPSRESPASPPERAEKPDSFTN